MQRKSHLFQKMFLGTSKIIPDFHACSWNAGLHKKEEVGLDIQACKSFFRSIWEGIEARV
jgi:hypothetical protein